MILLLLIKELRNQMGQDMMIILCYANILQDYFFIPQVVNKKQQKKRILSKIPQPPPMKRLKRSTRPLDPSDPKPSPQQQIFQKVNNNISKLAMRPSQHTNLLTTIKQQIKRPQTSKALRKDYRALMNLVDCSGRMLVSRERSMMSYKKMRSINQDDRGQRTYQPLFAEIQNTESRLKGNKYRKCDLQAMAMAKAGNIKKVQNDEQEAIDNFVESALFQGVRDIKALIPRQAKINKKLAIFGEILQSQKHKCVEDIKNLIVKQKQKNGQVTDSFKTYIINHYLMEKLMGKMFQDTYSTLKLKNQNSQTYSLIKRQMIGQIIKQKKFWQILTDMHEHSQDIDKLQLTRNTHTPIHNYNLNNNHNHNHNQNHNHNKSRLVKSKVRRHQRYGSEMTERTARPGTRANKENQITVQFEKIYEETREKLAEAQLELDFVTNRKHNFYSFVDKPKQKDVSIS